MRTTNIEQTSLAEWHSTLLSVGAEAAIAHKLHGPYASFHEALAILDEEMDELAVEIRQKDRHPSRIREEAIQVAGIAMRIAAAAVDPVLTGRDLGDEHL